MAARQRSACGNKHLANLKSFRAGKRTNIKKSHDTNMFTTHGTGQLARQSLLLRRQTELTPTEDQDTHAGPIGEIRSNDWNPKPQITSPSRECRATNMSETRTSLPPCAGNSLFDMAALRATWVTARQQRNRVKPGNNRTPTTRMTPTTSLLYTALSSPNCPSSSDRTDTHVAPSYAH